MKELITNLALFLVLCIAFSSLTACTGSPQSNTANNGSVNSSGDTQKSNGDTSRVDSSPETSAANPAGYPPLAAALADAEFDLLDGAKSKLSEHKGKVLLVNIWGTWCGPCVAEMPTFVAMQDQYRDKGLEIIGLNIGDGSGGAEPVEKIKSFVAEKKLNYTIAIASNAMTSQFYGVTKASVVPQTILIDREGRLHGVFIGGGPKIADSIKQNLEKAINE